jgi:hypothetical protein
MVAVLSRETGRSLRGGQMRIREEIEMKEI